MDNLKRSIISVPDVEVPHIMIEPGQYISAELMLPQGHGPWSIPVELSIDEEGNPRIIVREKDLMYVSTFEKVYGIT
jgi:hypothetical protein